MGLFSSLFGGGGDGGYAEEAERVREDEIRRQQRIKRAYGQIDEKFAGFDDTYYGGIKSDALNFYNPQVEEQASDAREQLIYRLARQGGLNSTSGDKQMGDLQQDTTTAYATVADRARGYAQGVRGDVESNRSDLRDQARLSADPAAAANSAINRVSLLSTPPPLSPLGDLFASYTGTFANAAQLEAAGYPGTGTGLFAPKAHTPTRVIT